MKPTCTLKTKALCLVTALMLFLLSACGILADISGIVYTEPLSSPTDAAQQTADAPDPNGHYTSKEDVMRYLIAYQHLPPNFMTKKEAQALGWPGGSLEAYAPGMCIGGDGFGNYEELLPERSGRSYYECDIDTLGASKRGAKRIIFSNDGLIYYTDDHYASFTLLHGEPAHE